MNNNNKRDKDAIISDILNVSKDYENAIRELSIKNLVLQNVKTEITTLKTRKIFLETTLNGLTQELSDSYSDEMSKE